MASPDDLPEHDPSRETPPRPVDPTTPAPRPPIRAALAPQNRLLRAARNLVRALWSAGMWLRLGPALAIYLLAVWSIRHVPSLAYPEAGVALLPALYYGLRFFALEGEEFQPIDSDGAAALLWFCLFAAPVITASALLEVFFVFRRAVMSPQARVEAMDSPVVVCGFGTHGQIVAEEAVARGCHVVIVDRAMGDLDRVVVGGRSLPVILGDMTLPSTLRQAGAARASHVWYCSGDPLVNLKAALATREHVPPLRPGERELLPMVDDDRVEALLVGCVGGRGIRPVRQFASAARQLVGLSAIAQTLDRIAIRGDGRIAIVGFGRFGRAVLAALLDLSAHRADGARILLELVDRAPSLRTQDHEDDMRDLGWTLQPLPGSDAEQWAIHSAAAPPDIVFFCTDQDSLNLRCAAEITAQDDGRREHRAEVVLRMFNPLTEGETRIAGITMHSIAQLLRRNIGEVLDETPAR